MTQGTLARQTYLYASQLNSIELATDARVGDGLWEVLVQVL